MLKRPGGMIICNKKAFFTADFYCSVYTFSAIFSFKIRLIFIKNNFIVSFGIVILCTVKTGLSNAIFIRSNYTQVTYPCFKKIVKLFV